MKRRRLVRVAIGLAVLLLGCCVCTLLIPPREDPTGVEATRPPTVTVKASPVATIRPTDTPQPTATTEPTRALATNTTAPTQTSVPTLAPTPAPTQAVVPTQAPVQATTVWDCSGDLYNCDSLSCSEIRSYFSACPGDPSDLDRDGNGRPCESRCG